MNQMKTEMKEINNFLNSCFTEMIEFTRKLIRINSINGNETEVAKAIAKKLGEYGIEGEFLGEDCKRLNLITRIRGQNSKRNLMLCGHMDTVDIGDSLKWEYGPLSGEYVDGKIYGRGSLDMKSGLTSIVYTAITINELNIKTKGDLILTFTYDEESGRHSGIKYIINNGIKADACIVAEPMRGKSVCIGSRGVYRFEVVTRGQTAHTGSMSKMGVNAVTKMAKVLLSLEKLKLKTKCIRKFPKPKITPTIVHGGIGINIVPDVCKALVDCRLCYGQTDKTILRDIQHEINRLKEKDSELKVDIHRLVYTPPAIINKNERIVDASCKAVKTVLGFKPKLRISGYTSDANHLITNGIPTMIFGCEGNNVHSENEYVKAESILNISKIFTLAVVNFLS